MAQHAPFQLNRDDRIGRASIPTPGRATFVLLAGLLAPAAAFAASLDEQVKAAYSAYDPAFAKQEARAITAFYTNDAVMLPPTHDIKRQAALEKFFSDLLSAGFTDHKYELVETLGTDQVVVSVARWSGQGKSGTMSGVITHAFVRQPDGGLKIRLAMFHWARGARSPGRPLALAVGGTQHPPHLDRFPGPGQQPLGLVMRCCQPRPWRMITMTVAAPSMINGAKYG